MLSYKRIYIFEEILYIISSKNCIFKTHEIGEVRVTVAKIATVTHAN